MSTALAGDVVEVVAAADDAAAAAAGVAVPQLSALAPHTRLWLAEAPVEVLQCRELRHAWPRARYQGGRHPKNSAAIEWRPRTVRGDGSWETCERVMHCIGLCGTHRVEVFWLRADGAMIRLGRARYRYPKEYRRTRPQQTEGLERLSADRVRFEVLHRLYPQLRW